MPDTQWQTYQVMVQEKPGSPYQHYGSVHAPDAEMALLNARDVFARRPEAVSMWVIPTNAIYSRTRQEIEEYGTGEKNAGFQEPETYHICYKAKSTSTQTRMGEVQAGSHVEALGQAMQDFPSEPPPFAWWIFPARSVTATSPDEVDSFFEPARNKPFRLSTNFKTHTAMRNLKR